MSGKKVLVISSSPRRMGNSDLLADAFIEGAREAGHTVEKINLHDKKIGFCKGCLGCQKTQHCILRDDMDDILPRMQQAEVIAFASPVYFYSLCGQLKTLLDRTNPLFAGDYAFRDIYLLASAADTDEKTMDGPKKAMEGWVVCFEPVVRRGSGAWCDGIRRHPENACGPGRCPRYGQEHPLGLCLSAGSFGSRTGDSGLRVSVLAGTFRSGCCPLFF